MLPLLPFALGLIAGALGVKGLKSAKARASLADARATLRKATASGLAAIEEGSAQLRGKLAPVAPAPKAAAQPARKRTAKPAPRAAARTRKPKAAAKAAT